MTRSRRKLKRSKRSSNNSTVIFDNLHNQLRLQHSPEVDVIDKNQNGGFRKARSSNDKRNRSFGDHTLLKFANSSQNISSYKSNKISEIKSSISDSMVKQEGLFDSSGRSSYESGVFCDYIESGAARLCVSNQNRGRVQESSSTRHEMPLSVSPPEDPFNITTILASSRGSQKNVFQSKCQVCKDDGRCYEKPSLTHTRCNSKRELTKYPYTNRDGAVAMSSANGLVGTGFASRYRLQPRAGF